jgi:hypothetical protein
MIAPLVPADIVIPRVAYVPIYSQRLFESSFFAVATDAEFRAAFCLWIRSWNQTPPGSLPNNDRELCYLAGLSGNLAKWNKVKRIALRHWEVCDDGRLYHPVVAELVIDAEKIINRNHRRTRAASLARWKDKKEGIRNGQLDGSQPNQTKNTPPKSPKILKEVGRSEPPPINPKILQHAEPCHCDNCTRWAALRARTA